MSSSSSTRLKSHGFHSGVSTVCVSTVGPSPDAVRATLRKEVEAGGWGPVLVSVESTSPNARFRVSFWNAEHHDLGAFAVHDPVLMSCVSAGVQ